MHVGSPGNVTDQLQMQFDDSELLCKWLPIRRIAISTTDHSRDPPRYFRQPTPHRVSVHNGDLYAATRSSYCSTRQRIRPVCHYWELLLLHATTYTTCMPLLGAPTAPRDNVYDLYAATRSSYCSTRQRIRPVCRY